MTREEAIEVLNGIEEVRGTLPEDGNEIDEALSMAIKALEQEPSGDAMSREELLKAIAYKIWTSTEPVGDNYIGDDYKYIKSISKPTGIEFDEEPSGDLISRQAVLDLVVANHTELNGVNVVMYSPFYKDITQLLSVKPQEPSGDAVSRQAVLEIIDGWYEQNRDTENIEDLIVLITYMDSVRPQEPKTGHWNCGDDMFEYAICSSCKHETGEAWEYAKRNLKYCPNCGARMVEPQNFKYADNDTMMPAT